MDSGSFVGNRADVNIQQQTASEVANTETLMADNEDLDPPPPQDISNVFQRQTFRLNHNLIHLNINMHGSRKK